jgi:hypothetical protein
MNVSCLGWLQPDHGFLNTRKYRRIYIERGVNPWNRSSGWVISGSAALNWGWHFGRMETTMAISGSPTISHLRWSKASSNADLLPDQDDAVQTLKGPGAAYGIVLGLGIALVFWIALALLIF